MGRKTIRAVVMAVVVIPLMILLAIAAIADSVSGLIHGFFTKISDPFIDGLDYWAQRRKRQ